MRAAVLFAGIGGWEIAAHELGIEIAWACEWDEWKAERYRERFPGVVLYGDVEQIDGREMLERHGSIDLLLGSPPCTDISAANHQGRGVDGDKSRLYFEAVRLAQQIRPLGCVFENSDRLRVRGADRVMSAMEGAGYACWPLVVAAGHAGAPHIRHRSWLVAADSERVGLREQPRRSRRPRREGRTFPAHHADADGESQSVGASNAGAVGGRTGVDGAIGEGRGAVRRPCHSASPGRSEWQGLRGNDGAQQPASERAASLYWDHEGVSLARHCRMANGVPSRVARKWISAYGDAVVVPVVKAILSGTIATLTEGLH